MNIKNWLVITGALTVLIFVGVIESQVVTDKRAAKNPAPKSAHVTPDQTVELTESGKYVPTTVTIKAGQTVEWVDSSDSPMWVASNPHPTHAGLPGFDQKEILRRGASWQFTFKKPGTFGYHDHLEPSRRGTVIVRAS